MHGTQSRLYEDHTPLLAIAPVDLATSPQGDWIGLGNAQALYLMLYAAAAGAADTLTVSCEQAKDAAGLDAKALDFERVSVQAAATLAAGPGRQYHQELPAAVTSVNVTGLSTQDPANMRADIPVTGDMETIFTVNVLEDWVDTDNGFKYVRFNVVASAARQGHAYYTIKDSYGGSHIYNNPLT